jgi:hypothetical protein
MADWKKIKRELYQKIDNGDSDEEINAYLRKEGTSRSEAAKNLRMIGQESTPQKAFTIPSMQDSMQEELASRGFGDKFMGGVGASMDRAALGLKGLVSSLSPQDQERLAINKQTSNTGPGIAGSIVGDVAMTASPSSAIAKLASIASSAKTANVVGQAALGAGYGGLTSPNNRLEGSVAGGVGAGLGTIAGQALGGIAKPIANSIQAKMMESGINLSPGQAMGGLTQWLENRMSGLSPNVAKARSQGVADWYKTQVEKSLPETQTSIFGVAIKPSLASEGRDAINEASDVFENAYSMVYSKGGPVVPDAVLSSSLYSIYKTVAPKIRAKDADQLKEDILRLRGDFQGGSIDARAIKDVIKEYTSLATNAMRDGNHKLGASYNGVAQSLRDLVGRQYPDIGKELKYLDQKYSEFLRLQNASGKIGAGEGIANPNQVLSSIREMDKSANKRAFSRGNASKSQLNEAEEAKRIFGSDIPAVGPGTAERMTIPLATQNIGVAMPSLISQLLYTKPLRKFGLGQYDWQKRLIPGQIENLGMNAGLGMNRKR